jgi:hypothetical protein
MTKATKGVTSIDMWPIKIRTEQLIAEARTLRGQISETGRRLDINPKMVWKSSAPELSAYNPPNYRVGAVSFQQRLKSAEGQGVTLQEFEKQLREF